MRWGIVSIGDEIISGKITNTNSQFISQYLRSMEEDVVFMASCGDNVNDIVDTVRWLLERADAVITTGGLGPTIDDKTVEAISLLTGKKPVFNHEVWQYVEKYYLDRGLDVPPMVQNQAMIIEGATWIKNPVGTAPCQIIHHNNKYIIMLPGVPQEMEAMLPPAIETLIGKKTQSHRYEKTYYVFGLQEALMVEKIKDLETEFIGQGGKIAYLPSPGIVKIRVEIDNDKEHIATEFINGVKDRLGGFFGGEWMATPETTLGNMLRIKGWRVATAESCTGGLIAHKITSVAGASDYYVGSIVAYSNDIKANILGVPREIIEMYGAVSEQTVVSMTQNAIRKFGVECAISVSGIAGPTGGTPQKPVGTVWICVQSPNQRITKKFNFPGDRAFVIESAANSAISLLISILH